MAKTLDQIVDVAIVGAGIVGLGHALAAVDRGMSVLVIDRGAEQTGSSIRTFGHIGITVQSGAAQVHGDRSRELWLRLAEETGLWLRHGAYVVAREQDELDTLGEFAGRRPSQVVVMDSEEITSLTGVGPGVAAGGAHLRDDLQIDPRDAIHRITAYLRSRGVEFQFSTAVRTIRTGRLHTTRGRVGADTIVVAVNHDVDQVFPEIAAGYGIRRCGLDMMRVSIPGLAVPLAGPVLTGWSMLRYSAFSTAPSLTRVRDRLSSEHPGLAALDLNQRHTQLPDGTVIVGDTHYRGETVTPFQQENSFEQLLRLAAEFFGQASVAEVRVLERWQGVYASAPTDFLVDSPMEGVHVVGVTSGIGMSTGLGFADRVLAEIYEPVGA